jgi:putative phosphoserine phosphatase/1-acylglycerol-3-phosphate O-acyltransferase
VVRVGPPVELKHRSAPADTRRVMAAIAGLLPPEAREPREPTEEELALTYPPGTS